MRFTPLVTALSVAGVLLVCLPGVATADALPRSPTDRPDDLKGPQVHVVYAVPSDGEDRELDTNGTLGRSVAGFQEWLSGQTDGRVLRMDTAGGTLDVTFFRLSKTDAQMRQHDPAIVREIERQLRAAGLVKPGKLYAVYYDGSSGVKCGGADWPPELPGQVAAMYLRGDPPGTTVCPQDPSARYWQFAMLHDTLHAAGFVPRCAPNHSSSRGHVSGPANDLMYGTAHDDAAWVPDALDVGHDDYYEHRQEDCPDLADSPYLSPRLPSGNFAHNPSFELDTSYWATRQGTLTRVPAPDAPHGDFAVKVSASTAPGVAFVSDCPDGIGCSVPYTAAGTTYVASAHARAAGPASIGSPVTIVLREYTLNGRLVNETIGPTVSLTSTFTRLTVAADAVASGHVIGVRLQQKRSIPGDAFVADLITIGEARPVMRVIGDPTATAAAVWTTVGANTKRVSSARLAGTRPVEVARLRVVVDGGAGQGTSQPVRGVIFEDAGGQPGELVGRTEETSIQAGRAAGPVNLDFRASVSLSPGTYWLGLHAGGPAAIVRYPSSGGIGWLRSNADSFADGTADPFGPSSTGTATVPITALGG